MMICSDVRCAIQMELKRADRIENDDTVIMHDWTGDIETVHIQDVYKVGDDMEFAGVNSSGKSRQWSTSIGNTYWVATTSERFK